MGENKLRQEHDQNAFVLEWFENLITIDSPKNILETLDILFDGFLESEAANIKSDRVRCRLLYNEVKSLLEQKISHAEESV